MKLKLILLIIILAIPATIVTYFALFESVIQRKNIEIEAGIASMELVKKIVDFELENVEAILNNAAVSMKLDQLEGQEEILKSLSDKNRYLERIVIVNRQGEIVASSNSQSQLELGNQLIFSPVWRGETVISDLLDYKQNGEELFLIAVPHYNESNFVDAVIAASVRKTAIAEYLNQLPLSSGGRVTIFDRAGKIVYHPFLQASSGEVGSAGKEIIAKTEEEQSGHGWFKSLFNQEKDYIFYTTIDDANWVLTISYPRETIWRPMLFTFIRNLLIYVISLAAVYIAYQNLNLLKNKELEEERQKMARLTMIGELAAGVAHEIRNPLTAVKGFLQLTGPGGRLVEDYYHIMYDEIEMMEKIINELLLLAGPRDFAPTEVKIDELLQEFAIVLKGTALLHNVEIQLECGEEMPSLRADKNKLFQVFMNIANNAIEAMENGGKLIISAALKNNKEVVITFKDTGPGIPQKILRRLGTPFLTTKEQGTGLGLLISSRIIQNHKGRLILENLAEGGAAVSVILPLTS